MNFEFSPEMGAIAEALAKAQTEIEHAAKDSAGQSGSAKYFYASLENVISAVKEPLSKNGLSFVQLPIRDGHDCGVTTMLMHSSGQWIRCSFLLPGRDKLTPQAFGGLITYARRYSLAALCGVGQEDDDAKGAQDETVKATKIDELVAEQLEPAVAKAKQETGQYFIQYNATMLKNAELINHINESAENADLSGMAIARVGMDDDEFAALNKIAKDKGGAFTDKARKMMKTQGFADLVVAEITNSEEVA